MVNKVEEALKKFGVGKKGLVSELTKAQRKPLTPPTWRTVKQENSRHQADLLFLPDDGGYRYLLLVVDVATKRVAGRPLKNKKAQGVLKALKDIYKKELDIPGIFHVDSGKEFMGPVKTWLKSQGMLVRTAATQRHSQQAVIEAQNRIVGAIIMRLELNEELESGEQSTTWREFLPTILDTMNEHTEKSPPKKRGEPPAVKCKGYECKLLKVGTLVRVALDYPVSGALEKGKHKKVGWGFRSGDIRWSPKGYKITNVLLHPGQPVRYVVEKHTQSFGPHQVKVFEDLKIKPLPKAKGKPLTPAQRKRKAELERQYKGRKVKVSVSADLTVAQLRAQLKKRGLSTAGRKAELADRLEDAGGGGFGDVGEAALDPSGKSQRWGFYVKYSDKPKPLWQPLGDVKEVLEKK